MEINQSVNLDTGAFEFSPGFYPGRLTLICTQYVKIGIITGYSIRYLRVFRNEQKLRRSFRLPVCPLFSWAKVWFPAIPKSTLTRLHDNVAEKRGESQPHRLPGRSLCAAVYLQRCTLYTNHIAEEEKTRANEVTSRLLQWRRGHTLSKVDGSWDQHSSGLWGSLEGNRWYVGGYRQLRFSSFGIEGRSRTN